MSLDDVAIDTLAEMRAGVIECACDYPAEAFEPYREILLRLERLKTIALTPPGPMEIERTGEWRERNAAEIDDDATDNTAAQVLLALIHSSHAVEDIARARSAVLTLMGPLRPTIRDVVLNDSSWCATADERRRGVAIVEALGL